MEEKNLMSMITIGLKRWSLGISLAPKGCSLRTLMGMAFQDRGILGRMLFTLIVLVALYFCYSIPLPFVKSWGTDIFSLFGGGFVPRSRPSLFILGITPFLAACGLIQLASIFIPQLRQQLFGEEAGRRKIANYTYLLTFVIALVESYGICYGLVQQDLIELRGHIYILMIMAPTAGAMLLVYIAELIDRYGIGNGIAMIFLLSLLIGMYHGFVDLIRVKEQYGSFAGIIPILLICVGLYVLASYATRVHGQIKLHSEKTGHKIAVPIRSSWVGTEPLVLATSLILLPATISQFYRQSFLSDLAPIISSGWIHDILLVVMILVLAYLYSKIIFKRSYLPKMAKRYGYRVLEEGQLNARVSKVMLVTAASLAIVSLAGSNILYALGVPGPFVNIFGAASIFPFVGICYDLIKQLEFFRSRRDAGAVKWTVCYVAFDEIEAELKKGFLEGRGIAALIEPSRFTWGLPIRTAVDRYRIHVEAGKAKMARELLMQANN